ncbi:hypothetical protein VII00023_08024, partial [Vibrio ichthyoenteri ATCC 700023]
FLAEHKVPEKNIAELKQAIESDGDISSTGQFGSNVSTWIGNMCSKAASGGWLISLTTAANVLSTGISKYYGLS